MIRLISIVLIVSAVFALFVVLFGNISSTYRRYMRINKLQAKLTGTFADNPEQFRLEVIKELYRISGTLMLIFLMICIVNGSAQLRDLLLK